MKQYLLETFQFNNHANKQVLGKIKEAPEQEECIRFFSHMINSMNKWLARIRQEPQAPQMSWWDPVYQLEDLEKEWDKSLQKWLAFLEDKNEDELFQDIVFIGFDGHNFAAKLKDIALQLNYHSIHHRGQIQFVIRKQGFEPDFVDYIGTVYRKID